MDVITTPQIETERARALLKALAAPPAPPGDRGPGWRRKLRLRLGHPAGAGPIEVVVPPQGVEAGRPVGRSPGGPLDLLLPPGRGPRRPLPLAQGAQRPLRQARLPLPLIAMEPLAITLGMQAIA